jgi:hypothetical protein
MPLKHAIVKINLGSAMLHTTSNHMGCGMWNVECGVMYKREIRIDMYFFHRLYESWNESLGMEK